jgi:putative redox protein
VEHSTGAERVRETVRTGPWLRVYEDLSGRDPAGLAAVELEALAEAAWWLCKTGPYTVIIHRPASTGGGGFGLHGGELLYLAVAGCVSNNLFREAQAAGIALRRVRVRTCGDLTGDPAVSTEITYEVDVEGDAPAERLRALVEDVDRVAEVPNSLRGAGRGFGSPGRMLCPRRLDSDAWRFPFARW